MTRYRWSLRRKLWLFAGVVAVLVVCVWIMLRQPRDFYYSGRKVSVSIQSSAPFVDEGILVHDFWDGPTGEFSHGDIFGLKFGKRMVRVDVAYEPIAAIKRDLPRTVPGLIAKLSAKEIRVRESAAEALIEMGPGAGSAMPELLRLYGNGAEMFDASIVELAKSAGAVVTPHLIAGLNDSNAKVRQKSAEALGELGSGAAAAVKRLTELLHDRDAKVAMMSAIALRKIEKRDNGEVGVLVSLLNDADSNVRNAAVFALGDFGEDAAEAVPALTKLLNEKSQVSGWAARSLGLIGKPACSAIPNLISLLDSENQQTVGFAAEALSHFGPGARPAMPKLVKLVENREHTAVALSALSSIGADAIPSLIDLYGRRSGGDFFVAKALMAEGTNAAAAVPFLRQQLWSQKSGKMALAAMTLGRIGEPAAPALPDLLEILESNENPRVRVRIAEAVWRLSHQTNVVAPIMVAELESWSKQPNALSSEIIDSYGESRLQVAVKVLAEMGPAARGAIPYLKLMVESSFEGARTNAASALRAINSE